MLGWVFQGEASYLVSQNMMSIYHVSQCVGEANRISWDPSTDVACLAALADVQSAEEEGV